MSATQKLSNPPTLVILSGLDPTGGAGTSADIRTATDWDTYPLPIVTALTAQNHTGIHKISPADPNLIEEQLKDLFSDIRPDAVKIGLLPNVEVIEAIAKFLKKKRMTNIVLDPVLSASSGGTFISDEYTILAMADYLLPLVTVITPNQKEFNRINEVLIKNGRPELLKICNATLITGGDNTGTICKDLLFVEDKGVADFKSQKIRSKNLHGTGCVYSTAIASLLAHGNSLRDAIAKAKGYILDTIEDSKDYSLFPKYGPVLI